MTLDDFATETARLPIAEASRLGNDLILSSGVFGFEQNAGGEVGTPELLSATTQELFRKYRRVWELDGEDELNMDTVGVYLAIPQFTRIGSGFDLTYILTKPNNDGIWIFDGSESPGVQWITPHYASVYHWIIVTHFALTN